MTNTTEAIKALREETGVSVIQCKQALEEADGDMDKAREILKAKGAAIASKKADRALGAGVVASYTHGTGTIGSMVELLCETDFVAKNEDFVALARDIAMQVSATDQDILDAGTEEFLKQAYIKDPSQTIENLVQGAVQKFGERTELGRIVKFSIE